MIDLRYKSLPDYVFVGSDKIYVNTDFREWLKFGEVIKNKDCCMADILFVIKNKEQAILFPSKDLFKSLLGFYKNDNETPRSYSSSSDNILDYILDGEYIVSSFYKDYKIDLTKEDMHWHLFKALFIGLSDSCKIKQIMSMRSWRKTSKSYDAQCAELKQMWKLPSSPQETQLMNEINEEFYNS